jgi:hypothetical protein
MDPLSTMCLRNRLQSYTDITHLHAIAVYCHPPTYCTYFTVYLPPNRLQHLAGGGDDLPPPLAYLENGLE